MAFQSMRNHVYSSDPTERQLKNSRHLPTLQPSNGVAPRIAQVFVATPVSTNLLHGQAMEGQHVQLRTVRDT